MVSEGLYKKPPHISKDLIDYLDNSYSHMDIMVANDMLTVGRVQGRMALIEHLRSLYEQQQKDGNVL